MDWVSFGIIFGSGLIGGFFIGFDVGREQGFKVAARLFGGLRDD